MASTNFSRHIVGDRVDRYVAIATQIGFGEVKYTTEDGSSMGGRKGVRIVQLTSTGVLMIKGKDDDKLITIYCATVATVKKYFGFQRIPMDIYCAIRSNMKRGLCGI